MVLVCHGWDTLPVVVNRSEFDKLPVNLIGREDEAVRHLEQHFRSIVPLEVNNCSQKIDKHKIKKLMNQLENREGQAVFASFLRFIILDIAHICDQGRLCGRAQMANGFCTN